MERIKDILGVKGHILLIEDKPIREIIKEARGIVLTQERKGYKRLQEIPEGLEKERLRDLLRALGLKISF